MPTTPNRQYSWRPSLDSPTPPSPRSPRDDNLSSRRFSSPPPMSSTSSEDKPDAYDSPGRGSATPDDNGDPPPARDEPDRKRRRFSEAERERRMARYVRATKESLRELDVKKHRATDGRARQRQRQSSSREPSRSRSEGGGRSKSPGKYQYAQTRVGKRVRRAPQRWEGERKMGRGGRGAGVMRPPRDQDVMARDSDGEGTLSATSEQYEAEAPIMDDPVSDMRQAVRRCGGEIGRRGIVDAFHTWQLQAVSKQAAQQKALQVFLKRRLRKRSARMQEIDRVEEDALRNARNTTFSCNDADIQPGRETEQTFATTVEDEATAIVPSKIRLPLDAYLPRRVRGSRVALSTEDIMALLPARPLPPVPIAMQPGEEAEVQKSQSELELPTVDYISSLNTHKDIVKPKKVRPVKIARKLKDPELKKVGED